MDGSAAFDGAEALLRSWGLSIRPDANLTVSQRADTDRMLGSRASAEPGRYRTPLPARGSRLV
jgi:phage terminase large subunit GpA-like protein